MKTPPSCKSECWHVHQFGTSIITHLWWFFVNIFILKALHRSSSVTIVTLTVSVLTWWSTCVTKPRTWSRTSRVPETCWLRRCATLLSICPWTPRGGRRWTSLSTATCTSSTGSWTTWGGTQQERTRTNRVWVTLPSRCFLCCCLIGGCWSCDVCCLQSPATWSPSSSPLNSWRWIH